MALSDYADNMDDEDELTPPVGALAVTRPDVKGLASVYDTAIQRLKASRSGEPSRAEKLFAISAALGSPTRTGTLGETFGNLSKVLGETTAGAREARTAREDKIAALEFAKAKELAQNEARFAELQMRYGTPKPVRLVVNPVTGAMQHPYTGKVVIPGAGGYTEETRRGVIGQKDPKGSWTPLPEYAQPNKLLKPIPAPLAVQHLDRRNLVRKIDKALAELERNPTATGLLRGVGEDVNQRFDEKGIRARAALTSISSTIIHDNAGASQAVKEVERLKPFVPSVTDTNAAAKIKLEQMRERALEDNATLELQYSDGYRPFTAAAASGAAKPATKEDAAGSRIADRRAQGVSLKPAPPEILAQARAAIAKGAPREAVAKRLKEKGFAPGGL